MSMFPGQRHERRTPETTVAVHDEGHTLCCQSSRGRHARFNNTMRQRVSRLVRETLSFSKKLANHIGAIKYFICHDNLTRAAA
jgi:hypothetical protein